VTKRLRQHWPNTRIVWRGDGHYGRVEAMEWAENDGSDYIFGLPYGARQVLLNLETEIVKRSDRAKGFVPLPKRWSVERTIAWLNRCRRLAKDWENLDRNALAFLKLASIRLMLRQLCNP
jgi:hypothetical protein